MARRTKSSFLIRNCQFAFQCKASWESLEIKKNAKVRFCKDCGKNVYLCETDDDLVNNVERNRCVAIYRREVLVLGMIERPADQN